MLSNQVEVPSNKLNRDRSDVDMAKDRLAESIEQTVQLSHHLVTRLESVLCASEPASCAAVPEPPAGRTQLSCDLHVMAENLIGANERQRDLLARLGL